MEVNFTQVHSTKTSIYISGRIKVKNTDEPIPGVNLYIMGTKDKITKAGTTANIDGQFNLVSDNTFPSDSLFIVIVGYHDLKYSIEDIINSK